MNWMNKLERKLGRYAIPNLSRYFVAAIVVGFVINLASPALLSYLKFDAASILHGQIWRLVTWIFVPVTSMDFFGLLFLFCVLMWGSSLESFLGTFRMNVFLIQGILISDIGGLLFYVITWATLGQGMPIYLSMYYILMSMLLALAICVPDAEVRIYFVLPIKMKWMLIFELLYLAYIVFSYFKMGIAQYGGGFGIVVGFMMSAQILLAIGSMFLFFWLSKTRLGRKQKKRQKEFRATFSQPRPGSGISQHKCAICGRTELTNPGMTFRYCSKCNGNYEYCEEHLFTHRHVQ